MVEAMKKQKLSSKKTSPVPNDQIVLQTLKTKVNSEQ